jgi:hypothetical protein
MHPYRYRCDKYGARARAFFAKCGRLGRIHQVRGEKPSSAYARHSREVHVLGDTGQARFTGLSWGDEGEAAKALRDLLLFLGLPGTVAEKVAFHAPAYDRVCWTIDLSRRVHDQPIKVWFREIDYTSTEYLFSREHLAAVPPVSLVAH